mgnify:CR=1 FL=1
MSYIKRIAAGASEERLEQLIQARLLPGADKNAIDTRIWDLFGEDWSIMFTDLSGFSRKAAEFGIIHFLQVIFESQRILVPCIERNDGIVVKIEGDSMLVIFRRPDKALECALAMQQACSDYNVQKPDTEKVLLCVGLGSGKILKIGDTDVWGAEVNAASKLGEDTAKAGEILVTDEMRKRLAGTSFRFERIEETPPGASGAYRLL